MDIRVGDILLLKKEHPGCGNNRMIVLRVGMDFKLKCEKCSREFMIPRNKCERKIKSLIRTAVAEDD